MNSIWPLILGITLTITPISTSNLQHSIKPPNDSEEMLPQALWADWCEAFEESSRNRCSSQCEAQGTEMLGFDSICGTASKCTCG